MTINFKIQKEAKATEGEWDPNGTYDGEKPALIDGYQNRGDRAISTGAFSVDANIIKTDNNKYTHYFKMRDIGEVCYDAIDDTFFDPTGIPVWHPTLDYWEYGDSFGYGQRITAKGSWTNIFRPEHAYVHYGTNLLPSESETFTVYILDSNGSIIGSASGTKDEEADGVRVDLTFGSYDLSEVYFTRSGSTPAHYLFLKHIRWCNGGII